MGLKKTISLFVCFVYLFSITIDVFAVDPVNNFLTDSDDVSPFNYNNLECNDFFEDDLDLDTYFLRNYNDDTIVLSDDYKFFLTEKEIRFLEVDYVDLINLSDQKEKYNHVFGYVNSILPFQFDSYLSVKKALLYLEKYKPDLWLNIKELALKHNNVADVNHDYLLNLVCRTILLQLELIEKKDVENVVSQIQSFSVISYPLLLNIAQYPRSINNLSEDDLKENFPFFYKQYQSIKTDLEKNKITNNNINFIDQEKGRKDKLDEKIILDNVRNLLLNCRAQTNDDWEKLVTQLKENINYTNTFSSLSSILRKLSAIKELSDAEKENIAALCCAAQRVYIKNKPNNVFIENFKNKPKVTDKSILKAIHDVCLGFDSITKSDYKDLVVKLKENLQYESSFRGLTLVLDKLSKNKKLTEVEKNRVSNFRSAARKIHENNKADDDLSKDDKNMLKEIGKLCAGFDSISKLKYEDLVVKLKKNLKYESSFTGLSSVFKTLSKNKQLTDIERDRVIEFKRAAQRIDKKDKPNDILSEDQKNMLSEINNICSGFKSITKLEYENLVIKLKENLKYNGRFKSLSTLLNKLSKNKELDDTDKNRVLEFSHAAQRIDKEDRANDVLSEDQKNMLKEINNICLGFNSKVESECNDLVIKLKENLKYKSGFAGFAIILGSLGNNKKLNQIEKGRVLMLKRAAERMFSKRKASDSLSEDQKNMLKCINDVFEDVGVATELERENIAAKLKEHLKYKGSFRSFSTALGILAQNQELTEEEKDKVIKFKSIIRKIDIKNSKLNKQEEVTISVLSKAALSRKNTKSKKTLSKVVSSSKNAKSKTQVRKPSSGIVLSSNKSLESVLKKRLRSASQNVLVNKTQKKLENDVPHDVIDLDDADNLFLSNFDKQQENDKNLLNAVRDIFKNKILTGVEEWKNFVITLKTNMDYSTFAQLYSAFDRIAQNDNLQDNEKLRLKLLSKISNQFDKNLFENAENPMDIDDSQKDLMTQDENKLLNLVRDMFKGKILTGPEEWRNFVRILTTNMGYESFFALSFALEKISQYKNLQDSEKLRLRLLSKTAFQLFDNV